MVLISCSLCDNLIKSLFECIISLKSFPSENLNDLKCLLDLYFQSEWGFTEHECQECLANSVENIVYFD